MKTELVTRRGRTMLELVGTVAVAIGLVLLIEAFAVKPYKHPDWIDAANAGARGSGFWSTGSTPTPRSGMWSFSIHRTAETSRLAPVRGPSGGVRPARGILWLNRVTGRWPVSPLTDLRQARRRPARRRFEDRRRARYSPTASGNRTPTSSPAARWQSAPSPRSIRVPAGDYYMMGDNRGNSDDSRYLVPSPQRYIIGVAFFTYWPPDRIGVF